MNDNIPPDPWRVPRPNGGRKPWVVILRPDVGEEIRAWVLSHSVVGVLTHWQTPCADYPKGSSRPCTARTQAGCPCCARQQPRWRGYLGVRTCSRHQMRLAEVTDWAAQREPRLDPLSEQSIRGLCISLSRDGSRKQSPLHVRLFSAEEAPPPLPPPIDVVGWLCQLWGLDGPHALACADDVQDGEEPIPYPPNGGG